MTSQETVTITRQEYEALLDRNGQLEDALAAMEADDGVRVPHEVALAIINGERPMAAYRKHLGVTLQDLSERTGLAVSYLSEIERGRKAGSAAALARIASALGTTIDLLVSEYRGAVQTELDLQPGRMSAGNRRPRHTGGMSK